MKRGRYTQVFSVGTDDIRAAYQQGKRDHAAGRSINAPRYADKLRDAAWLRGQTDAMKAKR